MKNSRPIFILAIVLVVNSAFGQQAERILIKGKKIYTLKLNNKIGLRKLSLPGENFEELDALGIPNDKTYEQSVVDETWTFYYDDLEITFIDKNGIPELYKIVIDGEHAFIKMAGQVLTTGMSPEKIIKQGQANHKRDLSVEKNSNKPLASKLKDDYGFVELILTTDGKTIDKIICQMDPR